MAVAFRSAGTLAVDDTGAGLTVSYPAGVASGDLLILQYYNGNVSNPPTLPGGWTTLFGPVAPAGGNSGRMYVLYKIAGGSEPSTVSVTNVAGGAGIMSAYTGADTTTPINIYATANLPTSGTSLTTPSVTTTVANTMLLRLYWMYVAGSTTITPAAGTERYDAFQSDRGFVWEAATSTQASAGASGTAAATGGGTCYGGVGATVAIAPLVAPSPPVANFTGTPLTGTAPLNVAFTDTSTNTPTSWAWDFGDSGTSTSQNPSHTYTVAGSYTVELDATNAGGTDNEAKVAYVVVDAPPALEGFSIAFDDPPMTAEPEWTRIDTLTGCHVQEYTIDRGRPTEFDKTDTGTAVVRLIDREGLFDPTNGTSPYNGLILPGKQAAIALQNPVSDEWFTLFRGFIESWHYRLDQTRQYMELELQLVDGFAILGRAILDPGNPDHGVTPGGPPYTSPPYATDEEAETERELSELAEGNVLYGRTLGTVKDRIDGILEDVGWPDDLRDTFTGNVRVGPKAYSGASALDAIWDAVDAEWPGVSNCWMSKEGVFTFRGRQARFRPEVAEYGINERTVGDPSAWELDDDVVPVSELEWSVGQDTIYNACSATPQWVWTDEDHTTVRQLDPEQGDNVAGQYVKNDASIAAYGLRALTFDQLQTIEGIEDGANSMVETKKYATYYVENYASEGAPTTRITRMVFKSRRPGNTNGSKLWEHLCKAEISDLLTLKTQHWGGAGGFLEDKFFVEGIHYTVRPGPPTFPIVELSLDLSSQAHYTTEPDDWAPPEEE